MAYEFCIFLVKIFLLSIYYNPIAFEMSKLSSRPLLMLNRCPQVNIDNLAQIQIIQKHKKKKKSKTAEKSVLTSLRVQAAPKSWSKYTTIVTYKFNSYCLSLRSQKYQMQ